VGCALLELTEFAIMVLSNCSWLPAAAGIRGAGPAGFPPAPRSLRFSQNFWKHETIFLGLIFYHGPGGTIHPPLGVVRSRFYVCKW